MQQGNEVVGLTGEQLVRESALDAPLARAVGFMKVGPEEAIARAVRLEVWKHMQGEFGESSPDDVEKIAHYVLHGVERKVEISEQMMARLRREAVSERVSMDELLDAALLALADEIDAKRNRSKA